MEKTLTQTQESEKPYRNIIEPSFSDLDPSLDNGYKLLHKADFALQIINNKLNIEKIESLQLKFCEKTIKHEPIEYKIELFSDSDPFNHFTSIVDKQAFLRYKASEQLQCSFEGFKQFLKHLLNNIEEKFKASFKIYKNGMGALIFTEILEFKTLNIITLNFLPSNELFLRKSIIYRYNTMKARYSLIEEKINDLLTVLKEKNPLLLVYLQKNLNLVPNYT